jgi:hypothetical protein
MSDKVTKWNMFQSFVNGTRFNHIDSGGRLSQGIIQSIQREDGSGHNFNVTLYSVERGYKTVFVRTID